MTSRPKMGMRGRAIAATAAGFVLVFALFAVAVAQEGGDQTGPKAPQDAARNAMLEAQGADMTPGVADNFGNRVGTMDERELVKLPSGTMAHPVRNENGELVGYMTRGDLGFVDVETGKNAEKLTHLQACYTAMWDFAQASGPPLDDACRAALTDQGFPIVEERDDPEVGRCLNMRGENQGKVDETCQAVLDAQTKPDA